MAGYVKPEIMGAISTFTEATRLTQKSPLDDLYNAKMRTMQERNVPISTNYRRSVIHCSLERIENGYLVRTAQSEGELFRVYYAEDLKAAGEQITALAVSYDLGGDGDDATHT